MVSASHHKKGTLDSLAWAAFPGTTAAHGRLPRAPTPRNPAPQGQGTSSYALQTSPGGSHRATNPKDAAATPPQPSGLPIGRLQLSLVRASPSAPGRRQPGGVGCALAAGSGRGRGFCSRRRGGCGAVKAGWGSGPGAAGSAAGPCGPGAGGRAGGRCRHGGRRTRTCPAGCPEPCLAQRAAVRQPGGMRRATQLLFAPPCPKAESLGVWGSLPPPSPMTAQGLRPPGLDCDPPSLPSLE